MPHLREEERRPWQPQPANLGDPTVEIRRGKKHDRVYGWRQTIENENNQSDRRKFLGRGRSMDPLHHLINEIGISMVTTGIAVQQARRRADDAAGQAPPWLAAA